MERNSLVTGIVSSVVATALLAAVKFAFGEPVSVADLAIVFLVSVGLIGAAITILPSVLKRAKQAQAEATRTKIRREFGIEIEQRTGLVHTFKNFSDAKTEITSQIKGSKRQYYFLQIGKTVMSGKDMIGEHLTDKPLPEFHDIRILH